MKYIKGVHRHGSETFLILLKDSKSLELTSIVKTSTTRNGINAIISECKGIDWYNLRTINKIFYEFFFLHLNICFETINVYYYNMINKRNFLKLFLLSFPSLILLFSTSFSQNLYRKRKKIFKKKFSKIWILEMNDN